jgi:phosphoglycolate phosphatase-like HAD superfamily hydrolase
MRVPISNSQTIKLVLFDIDGTLINPGEAGRNSLTMAFTEMFLIQDAFAEIRMAGKTDIQIIKEALSAHGLTSIDGIIPSLLSLYLKNLKKETNSNRACLKPGVVELLDGLNSMDNYWLGLLTGNVEQGARIKLGAFGMNHYFPLGAFGDDSEDRNKLLPIAVERFSSMTDIDINYSDCIVIGDTPMDVECAKPFGATSIAVSTGIYSYESLLETEADYVLKDLSNALGLVWRV